MNVNQSVSIPADFQQKSAVENAGREQDKNKAPQASATQETVYATGYNVEISAEGMQKAGNSSDVKDDAQKIQKMTDELQGRVKQLENAREQGKSAADSAKILIKCIQIAMRIISGDNVPWEDHQYLAEHNPELYTEAMSRRMPKEKPYKHEKLSEDEKNDAPDVPGNTGNLTHIKSIDFGGVDSSVTGEQGNGEQKQ